MVYSGLLILCYLASVLRHEGLTILSELTDLMFSIFKAEPAHYRIDTTFKFSIELGKIEMVC